MNEKTIQSKNIFRGKLLQLKVLKVKLPSRPKDQGKKYARREIISHPGAVAILPILPKNKIVFVRQYRKAANKSFLEIPAGTLDKNEKPLACARRELIEETGLKAKTFKKILDFYPSPGYSNERIFVYKASGLSETKKQPEPDEFLKTVILPLKKIRSLIRKGKIKDAKTIVALSYIV